MKKINVLSLFDGMGGGAIALTELGIPFNYYASEVDKAAIKQSKLNFPNMVHLGDVRTLDVAQLPPIDLLIGGSPCQSFSFAGKMKGMATKDNVQITTLEKYLELKEKDFEFEGQSYLFWEYVRILRELQKINHKVLFFLENVEMQKKWERTLSQAVGVFGMHVNSALTSAQNRKRIYWTNIKTKRAGLFGEMYPDYQQPVDRGIFLKDILEENVPEKYFFSEKKINRIKKSAFSKEFKTRNEKSGTVTTSFSRAGNDNTFIIQPAHGFNKGNTFSEKAPTLTQNENANFVCVQQVGRKIDPETGKRADYSDLPQVQRFESRNDGKTNCLTTVGKDNLVMQINPSRESGGTQPYQQNRVYSDEGIYPALMSELRGAVETKNRIRRLTPTECARLQTVPDWYKWECSATQQYKMLGNGWTIEVIKHFFEPLKSIFSI